MMTNGEVRDEAVKVLEEWAQEKPEMFVSGGEPSFCWEMRHSAIKKVLEDNDLTEYMDDIEQIDGFLHYSHLATARKYVEDYLAEEQGKFSKVAEVGHRQSDLM